MLLGALVYGGVAVAVHRELRRFGIPSKKRLKLAAKWPQLILNSQAYMREMIYNTEAPATPPTTPPNAKYWN